MRNRRKRFPQDNHRVCSQSVEKHRVYVTILEDEQGVLSALVKIDAGQFLPDRGQRIVSDPIEVTLREGC